MQFSGKLLQRGFWLYVWDIQGEKTRHLYVGRTGDSSSANASSPFARIGQHLEMKINAKGNAMAKKLQSKGIDTLACTFEMVAFGPLFEEQEDFVSHLPLRDQTAALERALADELRDRGYEVLGTHPRSTAVNPIAWNDLISVLDQYFPAI